MSRFHVRILFTWFDGHGWAALLTSSPSSVMCGFGFFQDYADAVGAAVAYCRSHGFAYEVVQ